MGSNFSHIPPSLISVKQKQENNYIVPIYSLAIMYIYQYSNINIFW